MAADPSYPPGVVQRRQDGNVYVPSGQKIVGESGGIVDLSAAGSGGLLLPSAGKLIKGFINLPLALAREIATNDYINTAGTGGILTKDTTPILERVNAATDKKTRIRWAASNSDEIVWDFAYPPDLDDAGTIIVNLLMAMGGATDTPTVAVSFFENVGDTNAGGNTAAVTGTPVAKYTVTIAASDVGPYPAAASLGIVVGAHTADTALLYGAWIEYTRKD